jgi:hypothetical protein
MARGALVGVYRAALRDGVGVVVGKTPILLRKERGQRKGRLRRQVLQALQVLQVR